MAQKNLKDYQPTPYLVLASDSSKKKRTRCASSIKAQAIKNNAGKQIPINFPVSWEELNQETIKIESSCNVPLQSL